MGLTGHEPPGPPSDGDLDDVVEQLRELRTWAGSPSYAEIARRVGVARGGARPGRITVYDCFRTGRRRLDAELVSDIACALGVTEATAAAWRRACGALAADAPEPPADVVDGLPPEPPGFVGRAAELARIGEITAGSSPVCVVEGMPGVGKTRLALRAAHGVPAAVRLFVNLHGYDARRAPARPRAVLGSLLRLLGRRDDEIHFLDEPARAALWRELLGSRDAVVVLDNAASAEQVAPLLPGLPSCRVLITSRRRLDGLPGATPVALDVLAPDEAIEHLAAVVGADRVAAEPTAAARIAELCGRLPLDLTISAAQVHGKPGWSLADHVVRLESFPRDEAVRPALALSYAGLAEPERRMFRLLTLQPGRGVTAATAAALTGTAVADAARVLDRLVAEHLLVPRADGRAGFHDVLRAYGDRLTHDEDPHREHHAARSRLLAHYVGTASAAARLVAPPDGSAPADDAVRAVFPDVAAAARWLDTECADLVATAIVAPEWGVPSATDDIATALGWYLVRAMRFTEAMALNEAAWDAADDDTARARAASTLGCVHERLGRYDDAIRWHERAIELAERAGDRACLARTLGRQAQTFLDLARYDEMRAASELALELAAATGALDAASIAQANLATASVNLGDLDEGERRLRLAIGCAGSRGDRAGVARMTANLGVIAEYDGRLDDAVGHVSAAIATAGELGDRVMTIALSSTLGRLLSKAGEHDDALEHQRRALRDARAGGDHVTEAHALTDAGISLARLGRDDEAIGQFAQALRLTHATGVRRVEVEARIGMAAALLRVGRTTDAVDCYREAVERSRELGHRREEGLALDGLAGALAATGHDDDATAHWRTALTVLDEVGAPEADAVRARLP